jgi:predicted O-methyltransferase YrrM
MWFKLASFFQFLRNSVNQHGVHSPFVFQFTTKCLYQKTPISIVHKINLIRKTVFSNQQLIEVTDFGKGSVVFKSNTRKVSDIAKIAGISIKKTKLLLNIVSYFKFESMLEIGTSVGLGTSTLYIGNPKASIITLEGCTNTATVAKQLFKQFQLNTIHVEIGNFNETLPKVLSEKSFDCIYFDGNHQKIHTLQYFNWCLTNVKNNDVFIFDDIYWSAEMKETWEEIKKHPKVVITIDTYYFGIVFFRKEQKKQHFKIRV